MKVHSYKSESGRDLILEYIDSLENEERVDGEHIYLLHACKKQKNKTESKDKKIVIKRAKELGSVLRRKFI